MLFAAIVGPNVLLLALFTYRPLIDNIRLSFFEWNISSPTSRFVGLENYREWFTRSDTWQIVGNTVVFTVVAVAGSLVLGLGLALGRSLTRAQGGELRAVEVQPGAELIVRLLAAPAT